jgi:ParB-like chromosome segregation protein Spo0J
MTTTKTSKTKPRRPSKAKPAPLPVQDTSPEGAWEELSQAYRVALSGKLEQLRKLHFEGVLRPPLQDDEVELVHTWAPDSSAADTVLAVLLVQRYERELGQMPPKIETSFPAFDEAHTPEPEAPKSPVASGKVRGVDVGVSRKTGEIVELEIGDLATIGANPAPDPDEVERLVADFRYNGQQEPIIVLLRSLVPPGLQVVLPPKQSGYLYLVLAGATRTAAAKRCGWGKIKAQILDRPMTVEEILGYAFRNNTHRRAVTTAEKAAYAAALAEALPAGEGLDDAIAQQMALSRSEVNQLRRFGTLPEVWQERVARFERDRDDWEGLSWTAAKALLTDVAQLPGVLVELEKAWENEYERDEIQSKDRCRELIRDIVYRQTRPVEKSDKRRHDYGWQHGSYQPRLFPLTDELREQLGIITFRDGDTTVERATNVELYDQLQQPYLAKLIAKNGNGRGTAAASKPAADERTLSLVEQQRADRAKHSEQDRELQDRIQRPGGLREQALRWAMASVLPNSSAGTGVFQTLLVTAAANEYGSQLDWKDWQQEAVAALVGRSPKATGKYPREHHYRAFVEWATGSAWQGTWDSMTLPLQIKMAQLIVFPQQSDSGIQSTVCSAWDEWPGRWPHIPEIVLTEWATRLAVSVNDTWTCAADPNSTARQWLELFCKAHTRRQLLALAKECRRDAELAGAKTGKQEIELLIRSHEEQPLPLPRVLEFEQPKPKKGKR